MMKICPECGEIDTFDKCYNCGKKTEPLPEYASDL